MTQTIKAGLFFVILFFGCVQAKNRGSQNLGNSCYFNATIQALSHVEPLNNVLRKYRGSLESFPARYLEVVEELKKTTDQGAIKPVTLYEMTMRDVFKKQGQYQQEDAIMLMVHLLNSTTEKVGQSQEDIQNELINTLGVEYTSTITCLECHYVSTKIEPMTRYLIVQLQNKNESLLDVFRFAFNPEVLTKGNEVWCCNCRDWRLFQKQLYPSKLPRILIIQMVRFWTDFSVEPPVLKKNLHAVSFPLKMAIDKKIYELRSFIVHDGVAGGGHYWAYAKESVFNGHWYRYYDSATPVESNVAVQNIAASGLEGTATPYILIYEQNELLTIADIDPEANFMHEGLPIKIPPAPVAVLPKFTRPKMAAGKLGNLQQSLESIREKLGLLSEKLSKLKTSKKTATPMGKPHKISSSPMGYAQVR